MAEDVKRAAVKAVRFYGGIIALASTFFLTYLYAHCMVEGTNATMLSFNNYGEQNLETVMIFIGVVCAVISVVLSFRDMVRGAEKHA